MAETSDETRFLTEQVLRFYPVGVVRFVRRVPSGLINHTFIVESGASGADRCVLQRLHPEMSSSALLADYATVTGHLAIRNFPCPRLIVTTDGRPFVDASDGRRYRLISYIDGVSFDTVSDIWVPREGACILGAYHAATADLECRFTSGRPLHDSPHHLELFRDAVHMHRAHARMGEAGDMVRKVEEQLPRHFLPDDLPRRVVHGDPKISNVLFDPERRRAVGLVDLDSCGRHTVLVDIGDAVRSWCREGTEDVPSPFLPERFRAVCEGYRDSGSRLESAESARVVQACRLITIELASRFLRDVFEDRYFGWDTTRYASRPDHNLARARGCITLFESMMAQKDVMEDIVRDIWKS